MVFSFGDDEPGEDGVLVGVAEEGDAGEDAGEKDEIGSDEEDVVDADVNSGDRGCDEVEDMNTGVEGVVDSKDDNIVVDVVVGTEVTDATAVDAATASPMLTKSFSLITIGVSELSQPLLLMLAACCNSSGQFVPTHCATAVSQVAELQRHTFASSLG